MAARHCICACDRICACGLCKSATRGCPALYLRLRSLQERDARRRKWKAEADAKRLALGLSPTNSDEEEVEEEEEEEEDESKLTPEQREQRAKDVRQASAMLLNVTYVSRVL